MRPKILVVFLVVLALAGPAAPAHAGGSVSICDEAHLRAALAGGGTVTFSCSGTITLTAEILIAADTTLDGSGQTVTLSGNHAVRVLNVSPGVKVNLNELTVAHGSGDNGGGIRNLGMLIVSNSTFSDNSAFSNNNAGYGGGIENLRGTLIVSNSTFSGNRASEEGGGIDTYLGTSIVSSSTFSGNRASSSGGISNAGGELIVSDSTFSGNSAGNGGGIINWGTLTVSNSTFSGNRASVDGGGIVNSGWGTLAVSNSTFSGNRAGDSGGGVFNIGFDTLTMSHSVFPGQRGGPIGGGIAHSAGGTMTVSNSTFAGNSASAGRGGGIHNSSPGKITLENSIVANSPAGGNCTGIISDGGGNLSYPDTTCPGIHGDPLLGPLQTTLGPTETMALGPGSAAIDAGNDATCAAAPVNALDQRGIARPWGAHCDIGAVEQTPLRSQWLPIVYSR